MNYGYKPTTHGRKAIVACMDMEQPLRLTRVVVGSGMVPEDVDLADVHELYEPVAEGEIGERYHEDDRLHLTIQYSNMKHPDAPTFYLSEFIVYCIDPETGEETDLLYATLGDYRQPVPKYSATLPASLFNFPLVLIVSDEINVEISAAPGLVSYDELYEAVDNATKEAMEKLQPGWSGYASVTLTIPVSGWVAAPTPNRDYGFICDVTAVGVSSSMIPDGALMPGYFDIAKSAGLLEGCTVLSDMVRFYAKQAPTADLMARINLFRLGGTSENVAGWCCIGTVPVTIPADAEAWTEADGSNGYNYYCDVAATGTTSEMIPDGAVLPGYFSAAAKAGLLPGCDVGNDVIRFYAKKLPSETIKAVVNLFGIGNIHTYVDPGVGLGLGLDGKLNVLLGDGLSTDIENRLNVNHQEVVTAADMLDEDETEESVKNILLNGTATETESEN